MSNSNDQLGARFFRGVAWVVISLGSAAYANEMLYSRLWLEDDWWINQISGVSMKVSVLSTLAFFLVMLLSPLSLEAQNQVKAQLHFFGLLPIGTVYVNGEVYSKHRITLRLVNPLSVDINCNVEVETTSRSILNEFPVVVPAGGLTTRSIPYDFEYTGGKARVLCNAGEIYAIAQYEVISPDETVRSSVDLHSVTLNGRSSDVMILYPPNTNTYLFLGSRSFPTRVVVGFNLYVEVVLNTGRVLTKRIPSGVFTRDIATFFIEDEFWPDIPNLGSPVSVRVRSLGIPSNAFDPNETFAMGGIFWNPSV
jgi:hypothetical protein